MMLVKVLLVDSDLSQSALLCLVLHRLDGRGTDFREVEAHSDCFIAFEYRNPSRQLSVEELQEQVNVIRSNFLAE